MKCVPTITITVTVTGTGTVINYGSGSAEAKSYGSGSATLSFTEDLDDVGEHCEAGAHAYRSGCQAQRRVGQVDLHRVSGE